MAYHPPSRFIQILNFYVKAGSIFTDRHFGFLLSGYLDFCCNVCYIVVKSCINRKLNW